MKKTFNSFISIFMICIMLVGVIPMGVFAVGENAVIVGSASVMNDAVGNRTLLYTYEQVQSAAKAGGMYALANDIIRNDSSNYDQIIVDNDCTFNLDLNGYTLKRAAMTVDNSLIKVKSGRLIISDSSSAQSGACIFELSVGGSYFAVVENTGGDVDIHGGRFELITTHSEYDSGVIYSEYGICNIYGGIFDATKGSGGAAVYLFQQNCVAAAPRCRIYDGEFYAKYITLGIGAMGMYASEGVMYSSIYVYGGKFKALKATDDRGGYAYCNNGWGRIVTVQGDVPYKSPNARDQKYPDGVTLEHFYEDELLLAHAYAPAFITDSSEFYETMRFEHLALKRDLQEYTEKDFSTIYKLHGAEIEETLSYIPEIVVDGYSTTMPYLSVYSNPVVENVKWYMTPEYNGESTKWYNLNVGGENGLSDWRFAERSENGGEIYVRADVTYINTKTYTDLVKIVVEPITKVISGKVEIINNVEYGNTVTAMVNNAPDTQNENDYKYEWILGGKVVSTEKDFKISNTSYIGKDLYCSVSCNGFDGFIVSPTLKIAKAANNNYPTTGYIAYEDEIITITAMEFDQEYLITAKSNSADLTEEDWKNAFTPMATAGAFSLEYLGLESYVDKTVYVYARFRETSTTQTGKMVTCAAVTLSNTVSLKTLNFKDIVNKTIYIPFTFEGDTVDIEYDLNPINSNQWNNFYWRTSYPLSIVSPTDKVTTDNNTGVVTLKITKTGGAQLVASYFAQSEVIYASANIVVYDPENPNIYAANVAYPLEDKTIKVGTTYTCEIPVIVPKPADNSKFSWYFTKSTQQGRVKLEKSDFATIDNATGLIRGIGAGEVDVTLYYGTSELDTFRLTVEENKDWVPANEIIINQNSLTLTEGNGLTLTASVYPVNATDKSVSWSSSEPLVASVDENGNIKALSVGTAVITVKSGDISATCTVTVKANSIFSGTGADDKPSTDKPSTDKPSGDEDKEPDNFMLGDVNDNGEIDSMDYILLKRNYFGTFKFDESQFKRGDVTKNGEIDSMDYILLKRAYFGTYTIN